MLIQSLSHYYCTALLTRVQFSCAANFSMDMPALCTYHNSILFDYVYPLIYISCLLIKIGLPFIVIPFAFETANVAALLLSNSTKPHPTKLPSFFFNRFTSITFPYEANTLLTLSSDSFLNGKFRTIILALCSRTKCFASSATSTSSFTVTSGRDILGFFSENIR